MKNDQHAHYPLPDPLMGLAELMTMIQAGETCHFTGIQE